MRIHETDWAQKYRPTKLEDMILPETWQKSLIKQRNERQGPSLLFYGQPGTGKTTAGLLINPVNHIKINCSENNGVGMVRELVRTMKSRSVFEEDGIRVLIMDDAENLTKEAQAALRGVMEDLSSFNMFIYTTNNVHEIIAPLQSRLHALNFDTLKGDVDLRKEMINRVIEILRIEGAENKSEIVAAIVKNHFPDMRKILKQLQFEVRQ